MRLFYINVLIIQETESSNKVVLMCYMCMVFKVVENGCFSFTSLLNI